MVEIIDEKVQRMDALLETFLDAAPFGGGDDARNEVEGENFLRSRVFSIDVECNTHLEQGALGGLLAIEQFALRQAFDISHQGAG